LKRSSDLGRPSPVNGDALLRFDEGSQPRSARRREISINGVDEGDDQGMKGYFRSGNACRANQRPWLPGNVLAE